MIHNPILIQDLALYFPHKTCFEDFSTLIHPGSGIAIMGRNGSGKSTLLHMLQGGKEPTEGEIQIPPDVQIGHVPQIVEDYDKLSGGQRFNAALTQALASDPNLLLLDEPTNHLDSHNRKSLMRLLNNYSGTLLVVTHDVELLRHHVDTLWHIDNGRIHTFSGNYDDYMREINKKRATVEHELTILNRQKKDSHRALMQEQERASKSKAHGEKKYADDKLALRAAQSRGQATFNNRKKHISNDKESILEQLSDLRLPEVIKPKFAIDARDKGSRTLISISEGQVAYERPILTQFRLSLWSGQRIALKGPNASGKSTLIKAIMGAKDVLKSGDWQIPNPAQIGYLDQHYRTLNPQKTVLETIQDLVPTWSHAETRSHLNDFLFRKNEEVNAPIPTLSGGEKARLSLAQIAAKPPQLLILDEVTNNLDLETRNHVIEVLKDFPGAVIVISHDEDFLKEIGASGGYQIKDGTLNPL
jgi:ATPase subunit of ABC transporter with duplicated ATPase domains